MALDTTAADNHSSPKLSERRRIRMDGAHTLSDVARKVCGDVRLAPLIGDINPSLPENGLLPAGTVVVTPSKAEAASFAKKMGFTLGFNEQGKNGTDARRAFAKMQGPVSDAPKGVDACALAKSLLARMSPQEAAKRLAKQCTEAEIALLMASPEKLVRDVGAVAEAQSLFPRAQSRLMAVRNVLDATGKAGGLYALFDAIAKDAAGSDALLQGCAVAPALRTALKDEAPRVVALVQKAKELAKLERGCRDLVLTKELQAKDAMAEATKKLVDAFVDGVEPLGGDRPAALGLENEVDALKRHLDMVRGALRQAEDGLPRASADVVRAIAKGLDGSKLPRPWPLLCAVSRDVGKALEAAPPTARDLGLGGILRRRGASLEGAPVVQKLTVADLAVRAASCARAVDEGDAFSERLAPPVASLFGLMRPPPAIDGGTPQARKQRRRAAFDHAMAAKGDVSAAGIVAIVADVLDRAKLSGSESAQRLTKTQHAALLEAAKALASEPLTIHRHPMSELGRALVVAAMALDRDVGQGLLRPTGREAFVQAAVKHAGRVLSAASLAL